jgi:hypothetical protein
LLSMGAHLVLVAQDVGGKGTGEVLTPREQGPSSRSGNGKSAPKAFTRVLLVPIEIGAGQEVRDGRIARGALVEE